MAMGMGMVIIVVEDVGGGDRRSQLVRTTYLPGAWPHQGAAVIDAKAVRVRQAVTLVENLPITTAAHFILVGLATTVFWNSTDPRLLIGWFLSLATVCGP